MKKPGWPNSLAMFSGLALKTKTGEFRPEGDRPVNRKETQMPVKKKAASKVKVKDLKAKKNPKGGVKANVKLGPGGGSTNVTPINDTRRL